MARRILRSCTDQPCRSNRALGISSALAGEGGDAGVARDEMAEPVYQRAMKSPWEGADSSVGYCGGEAGHVAEHRGGGGIVDRPGHLRAELMGGMHVLQLLLRRGT